MKTTNNTELSNLQVSIRSLSDLTGLHRDAIRSSIGRANLAPTGNRGGYPSYSLKAALSAVLSRRGDADPESLSPVDRRSVAQARLLEHQLQVKSGEYLPRSSVREGCSVAYAMVAQSVRSIPDLVERKTGADPDTCELIEQVIDNVCADLAERMEALHRESTAGAAAIA